MISESQMRTAQEEFSTAANQAVGVAREAELALEQASYRATGYARLQIPELSRKFHEADYVAESRAWISQLIKDAISGGKNQKSAIPDNAFCLFKDGNSWCCVRGDFINLQESDAGFGDTYEDAMKDYMERTRAPATA